MTQLDLSPLLDVLEGMLVVHSRLVELCAGKSRAIMQNDTAALAEAVKQENRLMHESRSLDRKRGQIVVLIAEQMGVDAGQVTASMIAERASAAERDRLQAVQSALMQTLSTQKEMNGKCRVLLEAHMEYAEMVLNLMVGDEDPINNIYGSTGGGAKDRRQTAGLVDTKA